MERTSIGQMRERVSVLSVAETTDAYGHTTSTPTTDYTAWAAVEVLGAEARRRAGVTEAVEALRVVMHRRGDYDGNPTLTERGRIQWRTKTYAVRSVEDGLPQGTNHIELIATRVKDA